MSHGVRINNTNYKIDKGKTRINGTNYTLNKRKTYVNNTLYNVNFGIPKPSSHTPRNVITWDNKKWLVCHYDSSTNRVYLIASDIIDSTTFGSYNYVYSTLAARCTTYQNNSMSAAALQMCVNVTVNGVTSKVFVPSYEQMLAEIYYEGFSWFNSDAHRLVASGVASQQYYWLSSIHTTKKGWTINPTGSPYSGMSLDWSCGFRPCICVQL